MRNMGISEVDPDGSEFTGIICYDGPTGLLGAISADDDRRASKWQRLAIEFKKYRVDLVESSDMSSSRPDFELHINARLSEWDVPKFAILFESDLVYARNARPSLLKDYLNIFSWRSVPGFQEKTIGIRIPSDPVPFEPDGVSERKRFCVMIAANKALPRRQPNHDLYKERIDLIRWFERYALSDFELYGPGWNRAPRTSGPAGRVRSEINERLRLNVRRPSWKGVVSSKSSIFRHTRFAIAYENLCGFNGYITEKIFDCFASGAVPVYWGANDVGDYIPPNCFIDRRNFGDNHDLYRFLKSVDARTYRAYQKSIFEFCSDGAQEFSSRIFAETVVSVVLRQLSAS